MPVELPVLGFGPGTMTGFLLVLARVGALWTAAGLPLGQNSPLFARWMVAAAVALMLAPHWPVVVFSRPPEVEAMLLAARVAAEMLYGLVLGLAVGMLSDLLVLAAQILGIGAGYGYASTIDPTSDANSGILLVVAQLFGWLLFVACGLDRELLRAVALSVEKHPPGDFWAIAQSGDQLIRFGQTMLETSVRLALPVVGVLLLIDLALAALGRLHAQLLLLPLAFPVKMLAALAVLAASLPAFSRLWQAAAAQAIRLMAEANG